MCRFARVQSDSVVVAIYAGNFLHVGLAAYAAGLGKNSVCCGNTRSIPMCGSA
jgi:hypothetical protein